MGWTYCFSSPYSVWKNGGQTMPPASRRKELDRKLTWESKDKEGNILSTYRVLKSAMVGSVYYAAVAIDEPGKETRVCAAVYLTCGRTKHDNTIWGYKDMDETIHPYYYDCPAGILALLTPTDSKCANEWRERCRRRIAERAERRKNGPKPLFVPKGVEVRAERGSWILSSEHYRRSSGYAGIRYTKKAWHNDFERVMLRFLEKYGTDGQREEYAKSGRECPESWKGAAA